MSWSRSAFALLFAALALTATAQDALQKGFQHPPAAARPQTWWHWINGNISEAGITADLEAMKKIGIGGAEIFNVDVGIPAGKTPFMSDPWNKAIAHAMAEGRRLGLDMCVHNCAGWSSSGGPWITPANSMQMLTWSETEVEGPSKFAGTLPQPSTKEGYYRDIAVYAVRKPADDSYRIPNIREKAAFDRGDRLLPDADSKWNGDAIAKDDIHVLPLDAQGNVQWDVPDGHWILIRMGYTPKGEMNHPAPEAGLGLEVDKLSRKALDSHWAGMCTSVLKDAGKTGNPGFNDVLIDSYEVGSQNWTPDFRADFERLRGYDPLPYLPIVTGRVIGSEDTSERFLWDFRRTICDLFAENYYGYFAEICHKHGLKFSDEGYGNGSFDNLQVCGAADIPMGEFWVGGGTLETAKLAASAGHIYGKPIIGAESFTADTPHGRWTTDPYALKALGDRAFSLGINRYIFHRYAMQPWLDVVPGMTMGPWGTHFDRTETWWTQAADWISYVSRCQFLLQSGRFSADILAYTGEEGPNDLPLYGSDTIPSGYDYDGCDEASLMKAKVQGGQVVLPDGMRYRVLWLPNDTWMTVHVAHKIADLVRAGATVVGPKPTHSPSLAEAGSGDAEVQRVGNAVWGSNGTKTHRYGAGRVYASATPAVALSSLAPDLKVTKGWDVNWIHRVDGDADLYFVANPRYTPENLTVSFRVTGKQPQLWNPVTGSVTGVDVWQESHGRTVVPLRLESAGSVFVVFRGRPTAVHLTELNRLSTSGKPPHVPKIVVSSARYEAKDGTGGTDVTAKVRDLISKGVSEIQATNANFGDPTYNHVKQLHIVYSIDGKPFDRTIDENDSLDILGKLSDTVRPDYTVSDGKLYAWKAGVYQGKRSAGALVKFVAPESRSVVVAGPWHVSFPPNLGAPASATFDRLINWPDSSVPGIKYFSGSATYRTEFTVPASVLSRKTQPFLDLGRVKNIAEVWLNGKELPELWKAPFRLPLTNLKAGRNELVVRVTNLWPNRLIGDEQLPIEGEWNKDGSIAKMPEWALDMRPRPKSERVTFTTWRFFNKDSALFESGLLGPVNVVFVPRFSLR